MGSRESLPHGKAFMVAYSAEEWAEIEREWDRNWDELLRR
jgi:hypothetical protein